MHEQAPIERGNLAAALLWAADWCNDALVAALAEQGWEPITRTQALVLGRIADGTGRPSALAREIGITRQSMQAVLEPLLEQGILVQRDDPDDGRATIIELGPSGPALSTDVSRLMTSTRRVLADRIGHEHLGAIMEALSVPWGPFPTPAELTDAETRITQADAAIPDVQVAD